MNTYIKYLIILFISTDVFAFSHVQNRYGKSYTSKFEVTKNTTVNIQNKYGNVDVKNWNKKEVEFVITVYVNENKKELANKVFENISIKINKEGNTIYANTVFEEGLKKFFNTKSDNQKIEINYSVYIPSNGPLVLNNKYGHVFINKLNATSEISVGYGSLLVNTITMRKIENSTTINLQYSSATLNQTDYLKINMKYSKIQINSCILADFNSKYSKCHIDKTIGLKCNSKYDEYKIGSVDHFSSNSGYTNYNIESINTNAIIENKYGNYNVDFIPSSFKVIKILHEYGSINFHIDDAASYQIDATGKHGKIFYNENAKVNIFDQNNEIEVKGLVGNNPNTNSKVKIFTKYGNVNLKK
jgi:hypothetical protein